MAFTAFSSGTAKEQAPKRKSKIALLLLLPGILYLMLFFLVPLIALLATSLQEPIPFGDFGQYQTAFRWQNYVEVITSYGDQILRSFGYAILATAFALLFSYPLAYFIGVKCRPWPLLQNLLLVLVIAPFFISFLLRTLAWKSILADEGFVITSLKALALMGPEDHFTGTAAAVVFGLTYNFIPFMTLPIYASLERLDTRLLEAGRDLYARPATSFFKITVPLSMAGIVSGVLLTFIPAAGDYINASSRFLGSSSTAMIGNVIESNFLVSLNYPAAAALSIILMSIILVLVTVYVKRSGTEDLL